MVMIDTEASDAASIEAQIEEGEVCLPCGNEEWWQRPVLVMKGDEEGKRKELWLLVAHRQWKSSDEVVLAMVVGIA